MIGVKIKNTVLIKLIFVEFFILFILIYIFKFQYNSLYEKKWKSVASLSCQRQQLCVCELNGNIYAIAGTDGTTRMSSVEMYTFQKDEWKATPSLQVNCRSGFICC